MRGYLFDFLRCKLYYKHPIKLPKPYYLITAIDSLIILQKRKNFYVLICLFARGYQPLKDCQPYEGEKPLHIVDRFYKAVNSEETELVLRMN